MVPVSRGCTGLPCLIATEAGSALVFTATGLPEAAPLGPAEWQARALACRELELAWIRAQIAMRDARASQIR